MINSPKSSQSSDSTFSNLKLENYEFQEELIEFDQGDKFGDIGVLKKRGLQYSIIKTKENCQFGTLEKQQFHHFLQLNETQNLQEKLKFIKQLALFEKVDKQISIEYALYNFKKIKILKNEYLFKENLDDAEYVYTIYDGSFKIFKNFNIPRVQKIDQFSNHKEHIKDIVGKSEILGIVDCLCKDKYQFTIQCNSEEAVLFKISKQGKYDYENDINEDQNFSQFINEQSLYSLQKQKERIDYNQQIKEFMKQNENFITQSQEDQRLAQYVNKVMKKLPKDVKIKYNLKNFKRSISPNEWRIEKSVFNQLSKTQQSQNLDNQSIDYRNTRNELIQDVKNQVNNFKMKSNTQIAKEMNKDLSLRSKTVDLRHIRENSLLTDKNDNDQIQKLESKQMNSISSSLQKNRRSFQKQDKNNLSQIFITQRSQTPQYYTTPKKPSQESQISQMLKTFSKQNMSLSPNLTNKSRFLTPQKQRPQTPLQNIKLQHNKVINFQKVQDQLQFINFLTSKQENVKKSYQQQTEQEAERIKQKIYDFHSKSQLINMDKMDQNINVYKKIRVQKREYNNEIYKSEAQINNLNLMKPKILKNRMNLKWKKNQKIEKLDNPEFLLFPSPRAIKNQTNKIVHQKLNKLSSKY
ncbi:Cyclic nucleotide-binding protein [Pseudocohnilembus persalinus]|uniref:Cyclic nucleotide-binding protein n=1 Tax=Pseudocohnilembus persalinus TaxID=266149 RepID=A0A0V0QUY7_PSEPJ|nr:Cyclic nucleotide-binding protein [Pseudocohnilembus persalinus]|eukprot:KRX06036.1 Cyclic nucleotide-binding protein [Pseudocohnilembus persalinus]